MERIHHSKVCFNAEIFRLLSNPNEATSQARNLPVSNKVTGTCSTLTLGFRTTMSQTPTLWGISCLISPPSRPLTSKVVDGAFSLAGMPSPRLEGKVIRRVHDKLWSMI